MEARKWRPLAALFGLVVLAFVSMSADMEERKTYQVFFGATPNDTTEKASKWVPIEGAHRIIIRARSTHSGTYTAGDSIYTDSLSTFNLLFSDSVQFIAVDSLGTIVTARSTIPRTIGVHGEPYPMCADSLMIAVPGADTTKKFVAADGIRLHILRGGTYGFVVPVLPFTVQTVFGDGSIESKYMRIRATPATRVTPSGAVSTSPNRTQGVKGLTVDVIVIRRRN